MLTLDHVEVRWEDWRLTADFTVPKGAKVAVLGPSGAGKSTLLSAIAGFQPLSTGRILWDGKAITALPPAARPAYLRRELAAERNCLVGANRAERTTGGWLYGVDRPFQLVTFGVEHLVGSRAEQRCPCGRVNRVRNVVGNQRR